MADKPKSPAGKGSARSVDAYLAALPDQCREALQAIRKTVQATVPGVEDAVVYGVPGFRLGGKSLVCYDPASAGNMHARRSL